MDQTIQINQQTIMQKVLAKFSYALLLMVVGMVIGALFIPPALASLAPILCLGMLIVAFIARWAKRGENGAMLPISMGFVYAFAALEGVGLYPLLLAYTQTIGAQLVLAAVGVTFVLFFGLATYAQYTTRDFLQFGSVLFFALIGLILLSIVGFFIQATMLQIIIAAGGIFIFSGYVLYDIQLMRAGYISEADIPWMVLSLFLDFINLLIHVLRLFGIFGSRD